MPTLTKAKPKPKKRAAKQIAKAPAAAVGPVAAETPPVYSAYELMRISDCGYTYQESGFLQYQEKIVFMTDRDLGEHAREVNALPLSNRKAMLDLLEQKFLQRHPSEKAASDKFYREMKNPLTPEARIALMLSEDPRIEMVRARRLERERIGLTLEQQAMEILKRAI